MPRLVRILLRIASIKGRDVIEALFLGQFETIESGGRVMVSSSTADKSFSFSVDQGLGIVDITDAADHALRWLDNHTADQLAAFLITMPRRNTYARYS